MCVPRLQVAGSKQGNLGRYLFFEIGKQRDERHIIEQGCRLETLATATCSRSEPWGELPPIPP